jgi:hypothetical protein
MSCRFLLGVSTMLAVAASTGCAVGDTPATDVDGGYGFDSSLGEVGDGDATTTDDATRSDVRFDTKDGSAPADSDDGGAKDGVSTDALDTGIATDTAPAETTAADTAIADTAVADSAVPDTAKLDTAVPDTAVADTAVPDTAVADTAIADTAIPDTATPDTAPGTCNRQAACSASLKCGGPTLCSGAVCYACGTSTGTTTGYGACADSSTCASGVCDSLRGHCSAACASGSTGDVDCTTSMGTGFVCTEITYTLGTATGTLGTCAKKCGRNGDCSAADVCQAAGNTGYDRIDLSCGPPPPGSSAMGAACTTGTSCSSRMCVSSKCSAPCVTAADCSGGLTKCLGALFTKPSGSGTQLVNVCAP